MRNYLKFNEALKSAGESIFYYYSSEENVKELTVGLKKSHTGNPMARRILKKEISRNHDKYKLHISLTSIDYIKNQQALTNILIKYIQLGIIEEFKCIDQANMAREQKEADEKGNRIRAVKCSRFLLRDQFTVYIPDGTAKTQLLEMCLEISGCLHRAHASGGEHVRDSAPINNYLNLKQQMFTRHEEEVLRSAHDELAATCEFIKATPLYSFLTNQLNTATHVEINDQEEDPVFLLLKKTEEHYKRYTKGHCRFSILHMHRETGRIRASVFTNVASRQTPNRNLLIVKHIVEGHGNLNSHSYRTLLLKNILFPTHRSSELSQKEALLFNKFLAKIKAYKSQKVLIPQCIEMLVHLALMDAPHDLIESIINGITNGSIIAPIAIQFECANRYSFITNDVLFLLEEGKASSISFDQLRRLSEKHIRIINASGITIKQALNFSNQQLTELNHELDSIEARAPQYQGQSHDMNLFKKRCIVYGEADPVIEKPRSGTVMARR